MILTSIQTRSRFPGQNTH